MITLRLDKNGGINKGDVQAFEHDNKSEVYIIQLCKNGEIYDLTDKTIELTMVERKRKIGDMVSLPIYNATEGKVKLEVVSDITKQDGIYDFKLTVKDTTGLIETFPSFQVKIENDITDHITGEIVQDKNFTILTEGLKVLADYNIYKTNALKVPEIEKNIVDLTSQLDTNTKKLNKLYYNVSQFEEYALNGDWALAINKAIEVANNNGGRVLLDDIYDIKSTIYVPGGTVIEGYGFTWGGIVGINCIIGGITALEIQGTGITLENFSVTCPNRFDIETHGIVLNNSASWHSFNNYKNLRIVNFNGYGVKFDSIHDSIIENISIELCGNENYYAFEITSHNDTSNHCVFNRIQVEQSYYKAMNINSMVMACNFLNIHSERTKIMPNVKTHILSGYYNVYSNVRIENSTTEKNNVTIGGSNNTYENLIIDGTVSHTYGVRANSIIKNSNFSILKCENIIIPVLYNCSIGELIVGSEKIEVNNSNITKLTLWESIGEKIFNNTTINNIVFSSTNVQKAKFYNCIVNSNITVSGNNLTLINCTLQDYISDYCSMFIQGCTLNNFSYDGVGNYSRVLINNYIKGNVTRKASGTITAINNYVLGTDFQKLETTDKICKPILL